MRILFITTHLNYGGITTYVTELARVLAGRGHTIYIASRGGAWTAGLSFLRISHLRIPVNTKSEIHPKLILAFLLLHRLIKREKIDIIHTHTRVTQVLGEFLCRATGVPHISTCHGFFKPRLSRRILPAWGKKTIAISEAVRAHLVGDFRLSKERISLIANGVDLKKFSANPPPDEKERAQTALGLGHDPVIGVIARLSSVKGYKYLIRAAQKILLVMPEVQFLFVGDGKEKRNLQALAKELSVADKIFFHPSIRNTSLALKAMDIFVLPSLAEGLGLAIIEAQASSLPVVASNVGGIYTLVKEGKTGLLVPPRDTAALGAAILKLLNNKRLALSLGRAGRKQAEENFSLDKMAEKIECLYQEVRH